MAIELGSNPWTLMLLTFLEPLFVVIPAFVVSKIEKKPIAQEIRGMGFRKNEDPFLKKALKILFGLSFGFIFFLAGGFILIFFRDIIVENLLGTKFVKQGAKNAITTEPIQPTYLQIMLLIIMQWFIVGPCEEGFFRGFVLKRCDQKTKRVYAVFVSSVVFAFYHVPPFLVPLTTIIMFFGYYFAFGVLLALIFVRFDNSLIPCSIAHSFFNMLILLF